MSAFIVEDDLIDLLATYAAEHRMSVGEPQSVGTVLVAQNWRSVNYRYRENDEPESYTFHTYAGPMEPIAVIKACDCYDYQACETDDYQDTDAAKIVRLIRDRAIGEVLRQLPAYDRAPWGAAPNPKRRGIKCGTPVLLSKIGRGK